MKLEADRMANLVINDAVVTPEREVIIEERRMRIDNSPPALFDEQLDTALYLHHPYRIPTIGWENEMHKLTAQDEQDFYKRWYAPNNAILVVAGDATVEQVKALAEKYFGPIPSRPVPVRQRVEEPTKVASARLSMKSPRVTEIQWSRQWLAPSYNRGDTTEAYPLQVLAEVLGGSAASPLYKGLGDRQRPRALGRRLLRPQPIRSRDLRLQRDAEARRHRARFRGGARRYREECARWRHYRRRGRTCQAAHDRRRDLCAR